jgi:hypothetical protein
VPVKRISASQANKIGIACTYGHKGQWRDTTEDQGLYHSRVCVGCVSSRYYIKHHYKVDPAWVDKLKEKQNDVCAICSRETRLVIDHDHKTGKVRGLLCIRCNTSLGFVEAGLVPNAERYLKGEENI